MSGVIPSPSGRRGSGSVVTPGGQVVAYHTRTNVSSRSSCWFRSGEREKLSCGRGEGVRRRDRRAQREEGRSRGQVAEIVRWYDMELIDNVLLPSVDLRTTSLTLTPRRVSA
jgi:hypothetical protein